jgi:hypothetical protein
VYVSWGRSISGGEAYEVASGVDEGAPFGAGTGPGRMYLGEAGPALAYPDRDGNAVLAGERLSFDAPARRHFPLDAEDGLVLDMAQTRDFTELRVLGERAPREPVAVAGGRPTLAGTMTVAGGRIYVAYVQRGRAHLATAEVDRDSGWAVRELPGPGGGTGPAAVVRTGGRTVVAYAQRGEVYLHDGRLRRVTRTDDRESDVLAAPDPESGDVYVAYTRRDRGTGEESALLERLGPGGARRRR